MTKDEKAFARRAREERQGQQRRKKAYKELEDGIDYLRARAEDFTFLSTKCAQSLSTQPGRPLEQRLNDMALLCHDRRLIGLQSQAEDLFFAHMRNTQTNVLVLDVLDLDEMDEAEDRFESYGAILVLLRQIYSVAAIERALGKLNDFDSAPGGDLEAITLDSEVEV